MLYFLKPVTSSFASCRVLKNNKVWKEQPESEELPEVE